MTKKKKMNGAKKGPTIKSFQAPLDSIKISTAEQKRLDKPANQMKALQSSLGAAALNYHNAVVQIGQSLAKLQQEQAMIGEDILRNHGKNPEDGTWNYNSDGKVIERSA